MLGAASFMALCILAATPERTTITFGSEKSPVAAAGYQEPVSPTAEQPDDDVAPVPPPKRLPNDPAYDGKTGLSGEGIPGLDPPAEHTSEPPKKAKPEPPKEQRKSPTKSVKAAEDRRDPTRLVEPRPTAPKETPKPKSMEVAPKPPKRLPPPPDITPQPSVPPRKLITVDDDDAPGGTWHLATACPINDRCFEPGRLRTWFEGIDFEGWLDQGVTINTQSPRDRINGPVTFNNRSNDYQLNQLYGRLVREVDTTAGHWGLGGKIDFLYGTDSIYTEARGLETFNDYSPKWNAQQLGAALPQCYLEAYCPWGAGLDMKIGHFYAPIGYETVAAPNNFFYSHSYTFQYGEPFTFTGLLGAIPLGPFEVQAGMTRGWDNWEDNNNDLGFVGAIAWKSSNQRTEISLGVAASREQPDPSTNIRTLYSLVIQQKIGDCWQYVFQHDFGNEPGAGVGGSIAQWYGINQYLYRTINEHWKAGLRFEWFYDGDGSRVCVGDTPILQTGTYYELTAGVNWTPNKHVIIRPEFRWDFTGTPDLYPFGDGTRSNQVLVDCDVIVRF